MNCSASIKLAQAVADRYCAILAGGEGEAVIHDVAEELCAELDDDELEAVILLATAIAKRRLDEKKTTTVVVQRTPIGCSDVVVFSAWVASDITGYSTVTTIGGRWHGRLGTERLPAELERLRGKERWKRVNAWQRERYADAYAAILEQRPEAAEGRGDMGEIEIRVRAASDGARRARAAIDSSSREDGLAARDARAKAAHAEGGPRAGVRAFVAGNRWLEENARGVGNLP